MIRPLLNALVNSIGTTAKSLVVLFTYISLMGAAPVQAAEVPETLEVTSSVLLHHGMVTDEYSAYGENKSIDLNWDNLPEGTVQLAVVCDDPKVVELGMMPTPLFTGSPTTSQPVLRACRRRCLAMQRLRASRV